MKQEAGPPESDSLTRALEEYLAEIEAGRAPSRDAFLRRYPDLSAELAPCLTALDFVQGPLAAESAPRTLGDFEIVREIGRGGMGVVYEAEQISLRRRVALKMLPFAGMLDPRQLQRFRNEAQAAAHLHHTNIVPVHSVGHERGVHFYAMQYIDGVSVAEMIEMLRATAGRDEPRSGSSSAALEAVTKGHGTNSADYCRNVARLGVQAAEALHHAHRQGIVHRDIKPANLIIDREGRIWITDFGLASFRDQRELTMTGDLVGTVRYMSPEQTLAKQMPVDHRTDVYSLGVTLHELVTLEHAFAGENAAKVLQEIAVKEPPHASRINPAVPQELETILLKAMSKLPEDRYATAEEMADDLNRFLEDRPIRARRPTVLKLAGHWSRRHKSVVWASLVVLLLAIAGLASATVVIAGERDRAEQGWQQAEAEGLRTRRHYNLARNALERTLGEVEQALLVYPRMTPSQESLLNEASRFYEGYLREAARDGGNRMEIALAHDGVARILSLFGDDETAGPRFERALDLYDELWREQPGDRGLGAELTRALIRGGRCWARRKDWPRAQEALTAAVDLARRQVAAHPGPETTLLEAMSLSAQGEMYLQSGGLEDALEVCRLAHTMVWQPSKAEEGATSYRRLCARLCVLLARIHAAREEPVLSCDAHMGASQAWERLHDEVPHDPGYLVLARRHESLARRSYWELVTDRKLGEVHPDAREHLDRSVEGYCSEIGEDPRALTSEAAPFHARAIAYGIAYEEPFARFHLRGRSSHGGWCTGETRACLFDADLDYVTLGNLILTFDRGDSIQIVTAPSAPLEEKGIFLICGGTGRYEGATGWGRGSVKSYGAPHPTGAAVWIDLEGFIRGDAQ